MKKIPIVSILLSSFLFCFSLTKECYCTSSNCGNSLIVLLIGWMGILVEIGTFANWFIETFKHASIQPIPSIGATIVWFANPFLIASWIILKSIPKLSLLFSSLALLLALSFLVFKSIIANEAGHYGTITKYCLGYWIWLSSIFVIFLGSMILVYKFKNQHESSAF